MSDKATCPFCGVHFESNNRNAATHPNTDCTLRLYTTTIDLWNMRPPTKDVSQSEVERKCREMGEGGYQRRKFIIINKITGEALILPVDTIQFIRQSGKCAWIVCNNGYTYDVLDSVEMIYALLSGETRV